MASIIPVNLPVTADTKIVSDLPKGIKARFVVRAITAYKETPEGKAFIKAAKDLS